MHPDLDDPPFDGLWYSLRRYHLDEFLIREVARLPAGAHVVDLGGKKLKKRGRFDLERYDLRPTYVNTDATTAPDILADVARVPLKDRSFDAALCTELLEHVAEPVAVLLEAYRLLVPGGRLLITAPFLHPVHADPRDYGRYTAQYWREHLTRVGFAVLKIEEQGHMWGVLFDTLRGYLHARIAEGHRPRSAFWRRQLARWVRRAFRKALEKDSHHTASPYVTAHTTGFGVVAARRPDPSEGDASDASGQRRHEASPA